MFADSLLSLVLDPAVRPVALGTAALGAVTGTVGTFAVVRRQSLQGDAVSHAALPGVALAYLVGGRSEVVLVLGAAVTGWVAMALVSGVVRRSRVPFDAALAGALAVFFGLGLVLLTYLNKHVAGAATVRPQNYLFGQDAALMRASDLGPVLGLGGGAVLAVVLFWKEFKLLSFDPDFAASLGLPTRRLDLTLTGLVVLAVVLGLQTVGVVLMSALIVAPAAAARQWSDRLGRVAALAALFGAVVRAGRDAPEPRPQRRAGHRPDRADDRARGDRDRDPVAAVRPGPRPRLAAAADSPLTPRPSPP